MFSRIGLLKNFAAFNQGIIGKFLRTDVFIEHLWISGMFLSNFKEKQFRCRFLLPCIQKQPFTNILLTDKLFWKLSEGFCYEFCKIFQIFSPEYLRMTASAFLNDRSGNSMEVNVAYWFPVWSSPRGGSRAATTSKMDRFVVTQSAPSRMLHQP